MLAVVGSSARFQPELAVRPVIDSAAPESRSPRSWCPKRRRRWRPEPGRRPEFPHAGSLRRRDRGGCRAPRADGRGVPPVAPAEDARARRARGRSTARPARHPAGARGRARCRHRRGDPRCRSPIRLPSRSCPPRSRTRPMRAASRSTSATMRRCWPRSEHARDVADGASHSRAQRAGAADDRGRRRGAGRLSGRPRCRTAGDGGERRRADRDRARPQPAPRAGRSRHGARDACRVARFAPLAGYRGRPAGDLEALAQAIVALSQLATIRPSPRPRSTR